MAKGQPNEAANNYRMIAGLHVPLGTPLPDETHAVSVSMPTWRDIADYEEGDQRVHAALRAGYPRFVFHPSVRKVLII